MTEVRTTHTGSLPRPDALLGRLVGPDAGARDEDFYRLVSESVDAIVRLQVDLGLTLVNDGEQGKSSYASYVSSRLDGFDGERRPNLTDHNSAAFPDFLELFPRPGVRAGAARPMSATCGSPIKLKDPDAVHHDIANLKGAAERAGIGTERLFMTAASPGVIALFIPNSYYPSNEEYLGALADAMRYEYEAIADAGIVLQLDCPDFAMARGVTPVMRSVEEFRADLPASVEALNAATANVDPDRMRVHLCWGNNVTPHIYDIELVNVIDIVLRARPAGISLEAANPRHGHEWQVFEEVQLPDDKYLLPGVIDTTTNFVEHPDLVAQRIRNYARLVGNERVIASTDCGFGTRPGAGMVAPSVMAAKLTSMVEGAAARVVLNVTDAGGRRQLFP